MKSKTEHKKEIISVAILRLFACSMIFFHHFLKSTGNLHNYTLSPVFAIGIFTFFAGLFAAGRCENPFRWILIKFRRILIPAWLVTIPLMIINVVVGAKEKTTLSYIYEILGLQLFTNQLFESTWFVSFILILYVCVFISELSLWYKNVVFLFIVCGSFFILSRGSLPYVGGLRLVLWLFMFFVGYIFSEYIVSLMSTIDEIIVGVVGYENFVPVLWLSRLTYCFYLVHASVLYFFFDVMSCDVEFGFVFSALISFVLSFVVYKIDMAIVVKLHKQFPLYVSAKR